MKICNDCGVSKSLSDFYSQKKTNAKGEKYIYHHPYCKKCSVIRQYNHRNLNREENLAKMREYGKEYNKRPENLEKRREVMRRMHKEGKIKKWQRDNRDKLKGYREKRNQSKKHMITEAEWKKCKEYFNNSCAYCGISEEKHRYKYGQDLHKDHLDNKGSNKIDNCVPACKSCNSSKGSKFLNDWYNTANHACDYYSEERLSKIDNWIRESETSV